jgi:hypothetical protein
MRLDGLALSTENAAVSDCSQVTIPPEAIVDLPILASDGSLSGRSASVPGTMKQTDNSVNSYAPNLSAYENQMSYAALSESTYAVIASELAFYKNHNKKLQKECIILDNQRRQIKSLSGLPGDMTKVVSEYTRNQHILESRLRDRRELEQYFASGKVPDAVPNTQRIFGLFQDLKYRIALLPVMDGAREYPIESLTGISADLDDLLSSVFGADTPSKLQETPSVSPILTSFELIQALTGASICDWVFGAEFQVDVMRTTPLLEGYRSLIKTCCKFEPTTFSCDSAYAL